MAGPRAEMQAQVEEPARQTHRKSSVPLSKTKSPVHRLRGRAVVRPKLATTHGWNRAGRYNEAQVVGHDNRLMVAYAFVAQFPSGRWVSALQRKAQMRLTPSPIRPILESQRTPVSLCNLPAQYEPDARATRLCRKKGNKKVGGIRNPRSFVEYHQIQVRDTRRPLDTNVASGFAGRVRRVPYQVNQELFQLVTICLNGNTQAIDNGDWNAAFEGRHPSD